MPQDVAFDVNETLLDLSALDPLFDMNFGTPAVRKEWFSRVLQLAFVTTITGRYSDFSAIGKAALKAVEDAHHRPLSPSERRDILDGMTKLPAHPDESDGLATLQRAGVRTVALTNSTLEKAELQLTNAGLRPYFQHVFSADSVRRLKPAPEPYQMAAKELGITRESLLLVDAHSWDIAGAASAGCATAFLARPGQALEALTPKPNFIASDLRDLAAQILATEFGGA
jgi:2-haloacid dehalogenase